jgi:hypothetical protein
MASAKKRCDEGLEHLLTTFKEPLQIELYATRSLPRLKANANAMSKLLSKLERMSKGKMVFRDIDTTSDKSSQTAAKDAGLTEAAFAEGVGDGSTTTIAQGYFGIVFSYGSEKEVIPLLSPDHKEGYVFWIANKMREIRDRADGTYARIGVVTGKDEIMLTEQNLVPPQGGRGGPSIQSVVDQALPFYKFEAVDLTAAIDADLASLLVTQPGKDFTDDELKRIDTFVMRGRSLVVIASAVNLAPWDPKMSATLDTHRLDKLLAGYGIEMRPEILLDAASSTSVPVTNKDGTEGKLIAPGMLALEHDDMASAGAQPLDNEFVGFFRLDEQAFPYASPLVPHPARQPAARLRVVARTSPEASVEAKSPVDLTLRKPRLLRGAKSQHPIAIVVDGELKSAFGSATSKEGSVLVVSSAQFLANPFARAGNPPPVPPQMQIMGPMGGDKTLQAIAKVYAQHKLTGTIIAFKNILDWMSADDRLIACSALLINTDDTSKPPKKSEAKARDDKKCSKAQMLKLMGSGLSLDDALDVCAKQK